MGRTASDAASEDNFGVSVSVSGDTAIIGAYLDDGSGSVSGSAYVYQELRVAGDARSVD
ncbi:FG-GAP repeat protein, partial [Patescibacteria group bacterium]|nr:FG-GAP repeat protein [Patescibacteria group bacterium]